MDIGSLIQQFCIPIIVVVCYCVCYAIKKAAFIRDRYIPLIAIILGGISGILMNGFTYEAVAIGIASGAAATGINQLYKQAKKDDDYYI
jgi:hypothetical protein